MEIRIGASREQIAADLLAAQTAYRSALKQIKELRALERVGLRLLLQYAQKADFSFSISNSPSSTDGSAGFNSVPIFRLGPRRNLRIFLANGVSEAGCWPTTTISSLICKLSRTSPRIARAAMPKPCLVVRSPSRRCVSCWRCGKPWVRPSDA